LSVCHYGRAGLRSMQRISIIIFLFPFVSGFAQSKTDSNIVKANVILDAVYRHYSVPNTNLLRENYPFDNSYTPDYLAANPGTVKPNEYAYLWPYSGTLSTAVVLYKATNDGRYKELLDEKIIPGIEQYLDEKRKPAGYASYINTAKASDRFYDDNIWLGIDFAELYKISKQKKYLDKAKRIWQFVWSGHDGKLGGGIYWCEQKKRSKNTCSNAPAAVFALKLFQVTNDSSYFFKGKRLYEWTKENLQDSSDFLYFDNKSLNGRVDKRKYSYNSGQMLQAAVLLHVLTTDKAYLHEAENIAKSAFNYFVTHPTQESSIHFRDNNSWFNAVMLRGFAELYEAGGKNHFMPQFASLLNHYFYSQRDDAGLFFKFSSKSQDRKWLLNQAGFAEMFAQLATVKNLD